MRNTLKGSGERQKVCEDGVNMDFLQGYVSYVSDLPRVIAEKETPAILKAAQKLAETTQKGGLIHIIGTGAHSSLGCGEFFVRPGSLMNINPIYDPAFCLSHGASRCWLLEHIPNYVNPVLDYYYFEPGEPIIIVNPYGINCATIDAAMWAREKGLFIIAVTSPSFSKRVPAESTSRHPSRQNLCDLADVVLDLHLPTGDAMVRIDGFEHTCAPVSTVSLSVILSMLNAQAVRLLVESGHTPDVIASPYTYQDAATHNREMVAKYIEKIKHL